MFDDVPRECLPFSESLEDTVKRVVPYFKQYIMKDLQDGNVIVAAHGNSIRALIKYIENISDDDIVSLEIPTGEPIIYKYENDTFERLK